MKSRIVWLILSCLLTLSMVLVSCGTKTTQTTTPTTTATSILPTTPITTAVTTPKTTTATTTGKWWDSLGVPQYGGTITIRTASDVGGFDMYTGPRNFGFVAMCNESLAIYDWAVDRKIWDFKTQYWPLEYETGGLADSWEQPDLKTVIYHIRKGIRWQDKPPVNGRELNAYDIEYHYHRYLALGSGFTKPSPYYGGAFYFAGLTSVTATDKYTVVFKWNQPSLVWIEYICDPAFYNILAAPREVIEKYGSVSDWRYVVGSSQWMLTDYVSGSALTYDKNPNYWGYDERHPQNKLPYADTLKALIIPDTATALSALRTGKIDLMTGINWQQSASLSKTNPELVQGTIPIGGPSLEFRCDLKPYTDIRVRKAFQMAIDIPTIAKTFYGGTAGDKPMGLSAVKGYYTPFDEWPQQLKDEYTYNPEGAKKLLAEAGFPSGFKTNVVTSSAFDLDLLQIIKSYFAAIGIDMEIRVMDSVALSAFVSAFKHDAMYAGTIYYAQPAAPRNNVQRRLSTTPTNYTKNNDPAYDDILSKYNASLDAAEAKKLLIEADNYAIAKHWNAVVCPTPSYTVWQPWLKGYMGEQMMWNFQFWYSRYWVDQNLKKLMGR